MLSKRAQLMKASPTLALAAKAQELKASGKDVISLTVGEPDWDTFENIKEAAIGAIRKGQTKYTPAAGIPDLRKAIVEYTNKELGLNYEVANVTASVGAKFVLFAALQAILDAGDEVIIPAPFWVSYTTMVELAEGNPRVVQTDAASGFKLTPALLKESITPKTKALLLNSPSNPTGNMYSRDELKALAEVLKQHPRVAVISDDVYNRLVFNDEGLAPHLLHVAPELKDRTIVINAVSKSCSMTGWRVGWAVGPKDVIGAMTNYQSQSVSCTSSISQVAAVEGLKNSDKELKATVVNLKQRRDMVLNEIKAQLPDAKAGTPEGAFYIWLDVSKFLGRPVKGRTFPGTTELAKGLLEEALVAVVPGAEFGVEGYLRLSYAANPDKVREAVHRMKAYLY